MELEEIVSGRLRDQLQQVAEQINETIDTLLPDPTKVSLGQSRLAEAMRYATLAPGKRLRPFLVVMAADLFGVSRVCSLQTAAAIEFIHSYSLIHDDLPALDNDAVRRGKPSCHVAFDEATAILAGDALLTMAFEVLSHPTTHPDHAVRASLVLAVAEACGTRGMVGGQMMDLISEQRELNIEEITRLQRMKTGALFAVSCEAGAVLGKASRTMSNALRAYAHDLGLAFQITDDLLDAEAGHAEPWSVQRQDKSSHKGTYVSALGIEKARLQSRILTEQAISHLDAFGKRADLLRDLAWYVIDRRQ